MRKTISKRTAGMLAASVLAVVASVVLPGWSALHLTESTDNAEVEGHISDVGARVEGTLTNVYVENNERVEAGQVLADIDSAEYRLALAAARAELVQLQAETAAETSNLHLAETSDGADIGAAAAELAGARAALEGLERSYDVALSRVHEAEVQDSTARTDRERADLLFAQRVLSRQDHEHAVSANRLAEASLETAKAGRDSARKAVDRQRTVVLAAEQHLEQVRRKAPLDATVHRANVGMRDAAALAAKAKLDRAVLNLDHCRIAAPVSGIVIRRTAEIGRHVTAGQSLFQVVQTDDLWVTANFKETQLRRIKPGQRVSIAVDAFPGVLQGQVESLAGATGAIASVLPPENATGNYVKVVQRLPVRIRFTPGQALLARLHPGMSVVPSISVGK